MKKKNDINNLNLITLKQRESFPLFNQANTLKLEADKNIKVYLDISTKRFTFDSNNSSNLQQFKPAQYNLPKEIIEYVSWKEVGTEILEYKHAKGYYNLKIDQKKLPGLLLEMDYQIIGDNYISIKSNEDINWLEKVIKTLFRKYIDLFYNRYLRMYEGQQLRTVNLNEEQNGNLDINSYELKIFEVDDDGNKISGIDEIIKKVKDELDDSDYPKNLKKDGSLIKVSWFDSHLYQPILRDEEEQQLSMVIDSITPKGVNKGEAKFVEDLQNHIRAFKNQKYKNMEFYLLRNYSRGKGFGFYFSSAGGFYPDFMLWIIKEDKQYLTFIDPHGLRNETNGFNSPKIRLSETIKELQVELDNKIILNSFILIPPPSKIKDLVGWNKPDNADLYAYANSLNVYEISQKDGISDDTSYIGAIIDEILK